MFEVTARLTIRDGELEGFKRQAAEMMRLTRELDTKTLRYDWFLSDDGTKCEVREAYVDADALIEHSRHIAEARNKIFRDFAHDHAITFYAEPPSCSTRRSSAPSSSPPPWPSSASGTGTSPPGSNGCRGSPPSRGSWRSKSGSMRPRR
jgi:quinol monooxygenase YgiN